MIGIKIEVESGVVGRWLLEDLPGGAVAAIDGRGRSEPLELWDRERRVGLVNYVFRQVASGGREVEEFENILHDKELAGFADGPDGGGFDQGKVDGGCGVFKQLGEAGLGVLKLLLLNRLIQEVEPDCFDFLHSKCSIFRYSSKVKLAVR